MSLFWLNFSQINSKGHTSQEERNSNFIILYEKSMGQCRDYLLKVISENVKISVLFYEDSQYFCGNNLLQSQIAPIF